MDTETEVEVLLVDAETLDEVPVAEVVEVELVVEEETLEVDDCETVELEDPPGIESDPGVYLVLS